MKTLDEVIKAYECCNHDDRCEDCPYNGITCTLERDTDALHYLKTIETTENLYHNAVNELNKWKDEDWKDRCLPLTWDELKQMEGKPVWVEYDGYKPMWDIIDKIIDKRTIETYKCMLHEEGIGIYWQAYRKENNGR